MKKAVIAAFATVVAALDLDLLAPAQATSVGDGCSACAVADLSTPDPDSPGAAAGSGIALRCAIKVGICCVATCYEAVARRIGAWLLNVVKDLRHLAMSRAGTDLTGALRTPYLIHWTRPTACWGGPGVLPSRG